MTVNTTVRKWNPAIFAQSNNISGTGASNNSEMAIVAGNTAGGLVTGYCALYAWGYLQTGASTYLFNLIEADMNHWLSVMPNGVFTAQIAGYVTFFSQITKIATYNPGTSGAVPAFITSDTTGKYGAGPPGSPYGGWGPTTYTTDAWVSTTAYGTGSLVAYNNAVWKATTGNTNSAPSSSNGNWTATTGNYSYINAAFWNLNVVAAWTAMLVALGKYVIQSGPYAGMTFDQCPRFQRVIDYNPTDVNFANNGAGNNPLTPANYLLANWEAGCIAKIKGMGSAFLYTPTSFMPGYGANGPGSASQTPADQIPILQALVANAVDIACTDVYSNIKDSEGHLSWGQNAFVGNSYSATQVWQSGGGADMRGLIGSTTTVEDPDYAREVGLGLSGNSSGNVAEIATLCYTILRASEAYFTVASESEPSVAQFWPIVAAGIVQAGGIPAANKPLPVSYMTPVTGVAKYGATKTTITVSWSSSGYATQYVDEYVVSVNGVAQPAVTGLSCTVQNLNPEAQYSVTVAMANSNGVCPNASAPVLVSTL